MHSVTHILRHKKSIIRTRRRAALIEQLWTVFERGGIALCIMMLCWLSYHAGAFVARQPVADEKRQFEHWAGQKHSELMTRESALLKRERRGPRPADAGKTGKDI